MNWIRTNLGTQISACYMMNKVLDLPTPLSKLPSTFPFPFKLTAIIITQNFLTPDKLLHRYFLGCVLSSNISIFFVELTGVLGSQCNCSSDHGAQMSQWQWFWWYECFPNRMARKLKKLFGDLKIGSSDSATPRGSRLVYKPLEAIPGPLDKPLSKQLLNETTSWESPLCSYFNSLVSKMIQVGKWVATMLWFQKSSPTPVHHNP